jgi:hypothetical protein
MYDIFYASKNNIDVESWLKIKNTYPTAQKVENVKSFSDLNSRAFTKMFWVIWDDLELTNNLNLVDYRATQWDNTYVHVFQNGKFFDGICLFPKNKKITQREFDCRFFVDKKEITIIASVPVIDHYDVIFISYNEPNADKNYASLLKKCPKAKRIDGIKGIHQAHIAAASIATTDLFYVVDGDAELVEEFDFKNYIPKVFREHVHVWESRNPINNLVYGYGGIKLLPRRKTLDMDISKPDMTTGISSNFKSIGEVSNITAFNTDPFNTWKSAFRECTKLSSKIIDRQKDDETAERLQIWCSVGKDKPFGEYAIAGALAGKEFGEANRGNLIELKKINDFDWLKEQYEQRAKNIRS